MGRAKDSVVKIVKADESPAGTAILVSEWHVLTCAHVVAAAIGIEGIDGSCPPARAIGRRTDLVLQPLDGAKRTVSATVVGWYPASKKGANHGIEDIAVLALNEAAAFAVFPGFATRFDYGRAAKYFGFGEPPKWIDCTLKDADEHWVQFTCHELKASPGDSGAPIFDKEDDKILGMLVVGNEDIPVVRAIPVGLLQEALNASMVAQRGDSQAESLHQAHIDLCIERLKQPEAEVFSKKLRGRFNRGFPSERVSFREAAGIVDWIATREAAEVQKVFYLIRQALQDLDGDPNPTTARRAGAERAAIPLFFLAACRLVDRAAHVAAGTSYLIQVPKKDVSENENLIHAVIAAALFGGKLEVTIDTAGMRPQFHFEVEMPAGAEWQLPQELERAVYTIVFGNVHDPSQPALEFGELTKQERSNLLERIATHIIVEERSLLLVVGSSVPEQIASKFAGDYRVPVVRPILGATSTLLQMPPENLSSHFRELHRDLQGSQANTPRPSQPQGTLMATQPPSIPHVQVNNYISTAHGDHSSAQAGSGNQTTIVHTETVQPTELVATLRQLLDAIAELSSPEQRHGLTALAKEAHDEAAKPNADKGFIKRMLDRIKQLSDVLGESGKVIGLVDKAYKAVTPVIGLPPSPLP